ncbi:hypothetical protein GM658_14455 [Pseudoduganella eburnea]|uniref:Uncharacterized protein n=1 Tax=Massilia eburnea TaxID=1776165 RepID=A0A6L6QIB6_9BURK|nr:hypothetical protein [Massilia eburnea]MTW11804.1 hypothetical protein [Massilia eburnea]
MQINIKRATAPIGKIHEDLRRLAAIVENTNIRGILCVIAEGKLPNKWVTKNGFRRTGIVKIDDTDSSYQVISVLKASAFLNKKNIHRAHYCCAIEVLSDDFIEKELADEELDAD